MLNSGQYFSLFIMYVTLPNKRLHYEVMRRNPADFWGRWDARNKCIVHANLSKTKEERKKLWDWNLYSIIVCTTYFYVQQEQRLKNDDSTRPWRQKRGGEFFSLNEKTVATEATAAAGETAGRRSLGLLQEVQCSRVDVLASRKRHWTAAGQIKWRTFVKSSITTICT